MRGEPDGEDPRWVRAIYRVLIGFVMLSAGLAAGPAEANFADAASGNCYYSYVRECYADSSNHNWSAEVGPRMLDAIDATLYGSYHTTDLTIPPRDPHDGHVDIWYHFDDADLPGGVIGLASCQTWSGHICDHWHVIFDDEVIAGDSDQELHALACHETGHTVGLMHPEIDDDAGGGGTWADKYKCMLSYSPSPHLLGDHNVAHINQRY